MRIQRHYSVQSHEVMDDIGILAELPVGVVSVALSKESFLPRSEPYRRAPRRSVLEPLNTGIINFTTKVHDIRPLSGIHD